MDTSLALQWVLDEPDGEHAEALLRGQLLAAPDVLFVEAANVLGKKIRKLEIGLEQAIAGLDYIRDHVAQVVPGVTLVERGLAMSVDLNHPVYDCVFLACAEHLEARVATRDAPFVAKVRQSKYSGLLDLQLGATQ